MSGQKISVKVIAEAEGKLVIETREGAEETYYLCPNRTMSLHVGQLHLSNEVTSFHFGEDNLRVATGDAPVRARHRQTERRLDFRHG